MHEFEQLLRNQVRVGKGKTLYRMGAKFEALYAIRSGSFKTVALSEDWREQVTGLHLPAEVIGTDAIDSGVYSGGAIALEDSEVCALPLEELEQFARSQHSFQHSLYRLLSREIARDHGSMLALGSMYAKQRMVMFLLDLSGRYRALGYSSSEFVLRATRDEIGSLLGLKLETVSRLFSGLHQEGIIQVQGRVIKILDLAALQRLARC